MTLVRKITSLFAGAGMLVAASGAALAQEKTVKVGLLSDFSGVFAQLAKDVEDAWMLALEERGGMVAGYKVEPADENGVKASALEVNIRSDRGAPFKYVQQVFDACIGYPNETPRAPIYKTSLAASPDKKE